MARNIFLCILFVILVVGCAPSRKAQVAMQLGEYSQAVATYEEYLRENPEDTEARDQLIRAYVLNHEYDKALMLCEEMAEPSNEAQMFAGLARAYQWDFQNALMQWACLNFPDQPGLAAEKLRLITLMDYVSTNSKPQNEMQLEHIELVNNMDPSLYGAGGNSLTMDQLNNMVLEVIRKETDREKTGEVIDTLGRSLAYTIKEIESAERVNLDSSGMGGGGAGGGGGG